MADDFQAQELEPREPTVEDLRDLLAVGRQWIVRESLKSASRQSLIAHNGGDSR
jgi:hypothetical protein